MRGTTSSSTSGSASGSGFALVVVLWVVALVSIVALSLATLVRREVQTTIAEQDSFAAELLADSGLAIADLLESRRRGNPTRDLAGLPGTVVIEEFHYRFDLPEGTVDLFFEGEDGKINLSTAPPELLQSFFSLWAGDRTLGTEISAAVEDWRDSDSQLRLFGAESLAYAELGYAPRNAPLGAADTLLIRGLGRADQMARIVSDSGAPAIRDGLTSFVTTGQAGPRIDPNLAPRLVLLSLPGISEADADAIVEGRKRMRLAGADQLRALTGRIALPAAESMSFGPPNAPAILSLGQAGGSRRSVRRVQRYELGTDPISGGIVNSLLSNHVERGVWPEFSEN